MYTIYLPSLYKKPITFAKNSFEFLKDIELAGTGSSDDIELLIGSDFYWVFNVQNSVYNHLDKELHRLDKELHRVWDLESLGILELEKSHFEDFSDTIYFNKERRYETNLPFEKPPLLLHDHINLCEKILLKLYSTLKKDTVLLKRYNDIFLNQTKLGIIELANENVPPGNCYYIPHHPVIREHKNTSKDRIVFDASAKNDGPSLNECLYKGPNSLLSFLIF